MSAAEKRAAPEPPELYYRYKVVTYACLSDDDGWRPGRPELVLETFRVVSKTPKGCWIHIGWDGVRWDGKKFILASAKRKHAHPTKEEALRAFICRKERQLDILAARAREAREGIHLAKNERWRLTGESYDSI